VTPGAPEPAPPGEGGLEEQLRRRAGAGCEEWRPRLLRAAEPAEREELAALAGRVAFVHDTLRAQVGELIETRAPAHRFAPSELARAVDRWLADGPPLEYGHWVHYPWSSRLLHVLPESEWRELRTSRNRNKITELEQNRLAMARIGVAGLSVGQATAVTLALEGVGGVFHLADFDALALSNMNRLRAGAHDLGVNKAVLTARAIYEIDPYARVELFAGGIDDGNIEQFLDGLDLLFEECDDLKAKVRLRERARALRIPVLMETSDRGLFDVERFDLEPERPIFHGLTGPLQADELAGMTTYEKVPIVLGIIGAGTMSRRLAASLIDIDATLKTWPQLASAVALGGAVNTDAARRILLGTFTSSGRFFVDLERTVCDGAGVPIEPPPPDVVCHPQTAVQAPALVRGDGLSPEVARALVAHAALAPSGGNCQPWRFQLARGRLRFVHDLERSRNLLDYEHRASYLAFGAAAENLALAARAGGLEASFDLFPDSADITMVCDVGLARATGAADPLAGEIAHRVTNRRAGPRVALPAGVLAPLRAAAEGAGAHLALLEGDGQREEIGAILGGGDRIRFLHRTLHREMMNEIRWTPAEVARTRDGLDVATLELTPTDLAGLRLVSSWPLMETLARVGGGRGLESPTRKAVAASSAVGLLTFPGEGDAACFQGGRALTRVWLTASAAGLAFQPMTALLYLFVRLERGGGRGLSEAEQLELGALRRRFRALFDVPPGHTELMLFRLARAGAPSARSLRRNLDDIFTMD
jgi:hypothetical protein